MAGSEELRFQAGDAELAGTLIVPAGPGPWPCVLLLSSWLARDRDGEWDRVGHPSWFAPRLADAPDGVLARMAAALAARGVASFRYDKRGCGRSAGDWAAADLFTLIDDARDALGALRGRPEVDMRRTGIVGHGEGAAIAMSVAIGDPAIGALTLIGPAARSLRDVWRRSAAARARIGVDSDHPLIAALDRTGEELIERATRHEEAALVRVGDGEVLLSLRGWEQAINTPPLALATMLHRSVSLVHGGADAWSHPDESRLLAGVLRDEDGAVPRLNVLDGVGHDLVEAGDAVIGRVADDLAARLRPRSLPPVLLAIEGQARSR
jgi:alpha-beta hydrolase superfamily lysophospholipase